MHIYRQRQGLLEGGDGCVRQACSSEHASRGASTRRRQLLLGTDVARVGVLAPPPPLLVPLRQLHHAALKVALRRCTAGFQAAAPASYPHTEAQFHKAAAAA